MIEIRAGLDVDLPAINRIFQDVVARGDTFAWLPGMREDEVKALWMGDGCYAYVAVEEGVVLGSYTFHANQPGRGAHVGNAAYIVSEEARGKGVGRKLGEHSLIEAKAKGFVAMQFNIVVSSNAPAVTLWRSLGFEVIGTTPKAFDHPDFGLVDAHIMHRFL